jgi:hypothetical protein
MKVDFGEIDLQGESFSDIIFLKNQHVWFFLSQEIKSRYFGGFLFLDNQSLRFLDDIYFEEKIKEIQILGPSEVILFFENNQAYLRLDNSSLNINFASLTTIKLTFDIKEIFKNEPEKRKINFQQFSSCCWIVEEFLEDSCLLKILIESDAPLWTNNFWQEKRMNFDEKRNSPPYIWWVYDGLHGKIKELKIKIIYPEIETEEKEIVKETNSIFLNFLLKRVNSFLLNNYLSAGFPWFFENWYRDELLSLYLLKNYLDEDFFKDRIKFYIFHLGDIWDKNKNKPTLLSADTFLLVILNLPNDLLQNHFNFLEMIFKNWQEKFSYSLPPSSTWMDTLKRKTALEISTLYLKALEKFSKIKKEYLNLKNNLEERLKEEIKIKPEDINLIFVYLYLPELFSKKEWQELFQKLLNKNFFEWGGLSSLSRDDKEFLDEDDGELAKAYHRGDSWYYLNNLAALCLKDIHKDKFQKEIEKIIFSSLTDLFFDGALGWSSEISSAKERRSEGSLVQLWSISSLIFLLSSFQNIDILLKSFGNSHHIITIKS